jgi:hypothetical protein
MKKISTVVLILISTLIVGCAGTPQARMPLAQDFYSNKNQVVGVYMAELPKTDTHLVGASCLLCYAAASVANSSGTSHIQSLDTNELVGLDETVVELISSKGIKTSLVKTVIDLEKLAKYKTDELNFAKQDFRVLKEKLGVDKLIVIDINTAGAYRPYSSYVPTGAPVGTVSGLAYTIDLNTNKYELYENIDFKVGAQTKWDEPPAFPGVTNAYYQAVEMTKDKIVALFK